MSNGRTKVVQVNANDSVWQLDSKPGVLFWTCALAIDADGSPQAYSPQGSPPALDYLANAGSPGNWWGIACNSAGIPYTQKPSDPFPGFYVSTTALQDSSKAASDPARYVDSGAVPFIVLPSKPLFSSAQVLGDLAVCFNNKTGLASWAVYADIGPSNKVGEGSMRLASNLGINSDPKKGGISTEDVAMIFWPGSKVAWPASNEELAISAWGLFMDWGGIDSAKAALPQFNWDQFIPVLPTPPGPPEPPAEQVVTITIDAPPGVTVNVVQKTSS